MEVKTKDILDVVRSTREVSLPYFGNIAVTNYKSEYAVDAVTKIDQQVETYLREHFHAIMPEVAFVGEEYGGDRDGDYFWLVDPIDGTGHYVRGIPFCTTMVALIKSGQVIFSAIYDFVNDVMYHAELGNGAYKDNQKISVSDRSLRGAYLSFEINSRKMENQTLLSEVRNRANIVHTLSAGFEFALVASGKIEGRLMYDAFGKDYDYASGSLLVSEAGGIVRNFKTDSFDYRNLNFIAANPTVCKELLDQENSIEQWMQ